MAAGDTQITVIGNIVNDPELRFTPNGAPVCNFRIASTPRTYNKQTQQWEDGEAMFLTCNVWRNAAENVAQSVTKGTRAIVHGKLKSRTYQTRDGDNRTVFEIDVEEIGPSLKYAAAQVERNPRESGDQGKAQHYGPQSGPFSQGGQTQQERGGFGNQPAQDGQAAQGGDPWSKAPAAPAQDDNPPF